MASRKRRVNHKVVFRAKVIGGTPRRVQAKVQAKARAAGAAGTVRRVMGSQRARRGGAGYLDYSGGRPRFIQSVWDVRREARQLVRESLRTRQRRGGGRRGLGIDIVYIDGVPITVSKGAARSVKRYVEEGKMKLVTPDDQIRQIQEYAKKNGIAFKQVNGAVTYSDISSFCAKNPNGILVYKGGSYFGVPTYQAVQCYNGRPTVFHSLTPGLRWTGW